MAMDTNAQESLAALKQKFPCGVSNVRSLSEEQKSWLQMKIQCLSKSVEVSSVESELNKIHNRLIHATEDIPDSELEEMVSFVFDNMNEVAELINRKTNEFVKEPKTITQI